MTSTNLKDGWETCRVLYRQCYAMPKFVTLDIISSETFNGAMEKPSVPRKRRSTSYTVDSKRPRVVVINDAEEGQEHFLGWEEPCVLTKGEYHESLKAKWNRLSQKVIAHFGAKEMASLCQELDLVCFSDDLSSVMNSDRPNTTTTTAVENTSLRAELEELHARNRELESRLEEIVEKTCGEVQSAGSTESDTVIFDRKSKALKEALEKRNADLDETNEKQGLMLDFYMTRMEDLKTRIGELEDRLANPRRTEYFGKEKEEENSLELLRMQNNKLKEELTRVRSQLEVSEIQLDLEIEKKDEAISELMTLQNQKAFADAELVELQKWRQTFEAEKDELAGLRSEKTIYEVAMNELADIRSQKEVCEVERIELAELRSRKRILEAAEAELTELRIQKQKFEAAEKETLELRKRKGVFEADTEDDDMKPIQKKQFELVTDELHSLRRQKGNLDATAEELAELRQQKAVYDGVSEELSALRREREISAKEIVDLRKHKKIPKAERDELDTLRRQRAVYEAAEKDLATIRGREMAMVAREQNLVAKQAKLVGNIRYLEMKRSEDQQEHDQHRLDLEAARAKIHQTSLNLKAAEQQWVSVRKEKESLQEDKIRWLKVKRELQEENDHLFKEKHNLQKRLNAEIANLLSQVEDEKAKQEEIARGGEVEYLKEELRLKQEKYEGETEKLLKEAESLREANRAYIDRERKLRREMSMVTKRLDNATSGDLCHICLINSRDTVILPCTHMQSCVRCVKELIQNDKACPTCDRAISGYVPCNTDV
ncbi:hypothetical protein Mapa_012020 [Marchantia paleacea]|nr:hypothetical protein Mapa_012020 [Marchantia paleacea]